MWQDPEPITVVKLGELLLVLAPSMSLLASRKAANNSANDEKFEPHSCACYRLLGLEAAEAAPSFAPVSEVVSWQCKAQAVITAAGCEHMQVNSITPSICHVLHHPDVGNKEGKTKLFMIVSEPWHPYPNPTEDGQSLLKSKSDETWRRKCCTPWNLHHFHFLVRAHLWCSLVSLMCPAIAFGYASHPLHLLLPVIC